MESPFSTASAATAETDGPTLWCIAGTIITNEGLVPGIYACIEQRTPETL